MSQVQVLLILIQIVMAFQAAAPSHERLQFFIDFANSGVAGLESDELLPILETSANPFILHKLIDKAPNQVSAYVDYCMKQSASFTPDERFICDCKNYIPKELLSRLKQNQIEGATKIQVLFHVTQENFSEAIVRSSIFEPISIQNETFILLPSLATILHRWDQKYLKGECVKFEEKILLPAYLRWFCGVCKWIDSDDDFWSALISIIQEELHQELVGKLMSNFVRRIVKKKRSIFKTKVLRALALVAATITIDEALLIELLNMADIKDQSAVLLLNSCGLPF